MSFASAVANLKLNITDFASNMRKASSMMAKFAASSATGSATASKNFSEYSKAIRTANKELGLHRFGLKDTARIVQGILVSQAFYRIAGAIRESIGALWEFNESLDYAGVTYSALMGSNELSDSFLVALREQAEQTIFSFQDLTDASKKLLAYGIPYKNLMFISEGLTNLGAMSGDTAALDRISLALGQIYAKGKLSAEEMRQLANAYVPIQDIVRNRFNLSDDQMGKIGDLNLPAAEVINAIVDYANENFGAVGDAAMYTITGLKNKISDSLKNLGVDILRPLTTFYKSLLAFLAKKTQEIGDVFDKGGIKGVFEYLVPNENTQQLIRQTLANISNLLKVTLSFFKTIGTVGKQFVANLAAMFNVLGPVVNSVLSVIVGALETIAKNAALVKVLTVALATCTAAWVAFKVGALRAMVVGALSKVILGLAKAVAALSAVLARSPIVTAFLLISLGLASIAAASGKADSAISSLFDKLSGLNGKSSNDVLQDTTGNLTDAADAADDFNNRLENVKDSTDEIGDAADSAGSKAKKAAKGLLSFDEVFKLAEKGSAGSGAGSGGYDLDNMLEGLGNLGAGIDDALVPEIPDLSEFGSNYVNTLKDSILGKLTIAGLGLWLAKLLSDAVKKANLTGPAGALAAKFAKALGGAFVGIGLDAIIQPFTEKLWNLLADKLDLSKDSAAQAKIGASIGSGIGGAIGMVLGGIPGTLIGTSIGHLAGGIVGLFWDAISGAFNNTALFGGLGIAQAIADAFGGTISQLPSLISTNSFSAFFKSIADLFKGTGLKALAKGGIIGMAIGFISDAIAALLWDTLAESLQLSADSVGNAKVGQTIGSIIGSIIGGIIGGPVGIMLGSVIGTFAGGFAGLFWDKINTALNEHFSPENNPITAFIVESANGLTDWWSSTKDGFTLWANDTLSSFSTWWNDTKSGFTTWWDDTKSGLSTWWDDTVKLFSDWDNINGDTLSDWWSDTSSSFSDWKTDTFGKLSSWWDNTTGGFSTWVNDTKKDLGVWAIDTTLRFNNWKHEALQPIAGWVSEATEDIADWAEQTGEDIGTWASNTAKDIKDWYIQADKDINEFVDSTGKLLGGFAIATGKAIGKWLDDTWSDIENWFDETKTNVGNWWNKVWDIKTWTTGWGKVQAWFGALKTDVQKWFDNLNIGSFWSKLWDTKAWKSGWSSVKTWFDNLGSDIAKWFSNLWDDVSNWWKNLWTGKKSTVTKNGDSGSVSTSVGNKPNFSYRGYATGGIIDREQIARIGEGGKREAIIPLENATAMQPFVDAVANGIIQGLAPTLAVASGPSAASLPPMYIGTLIADDRGIEELYKKFELIEAKENVRRVSR